MLFFFFFFFRSAFYRRFIKYIVDFEKGILLKQKSVVHGLQLLTYPK